MLGERVLHLDLRRGAGAPDGPRRPVLEDERQRGNRRGGARRPDTFSPDGQRDRRRDRLRPRAAGRRAAAPRGRATPPDTHMFCSAIGLATRAAMPCRSPVGEWQLAHCLAKNVSPALASPTRMFSSVSGPGGGPPWLVPCACRLCSQAAIGLDVVDGHRQRRHRRRAGPAVLHHRDDQLPVLVVEHQLRAQQVGTAELTAAGVGAVAGAAEPAYCALPRSSSSGDAGGRWCAGKRGGSWKPPAGRGGGAGSPCAPGCAGAGCGWRGWAAGWAAGRAPGRRRAGPPRARGRAPARSSKRDVGTSGPVSFVVVICLHVTTHPGDSRVADDGLTTPAAHRRAAVVSDQKTAAWQRGARLGVCTPDSMRSAPADCGRAFTDSPGAGPFPRPADDPARSLQKRRVRCWPTLGITASAPCC